MIYATYKTIPALIAEQTKLRPDAPVIIAPDRKLLTYRCLSEHIVQTADTIRAMGLAGRRIALVVNDRPNSVVSLLALASCATVVPFNPTMRPEEYDTLLSRTKAVAVIVEAGLTDVAPALVEIADRLRIAYIELASEPEAGIFTLQQLRQGGDQIQGAPDKERQPDDIALILTTSGTTSVPKIVPILHSQICANTAFRARSLSLTDQDRLLLTMPVFHESGLANMLAALSVGSSVAAMPAFDPAAFYTWLDEQRPTWFTGTPTLLQALVLHAETPANREIIARSSLRLLRTGTAALPRALLEETERIFGVPVYQGYGSSEAGPITSEPLLPAPRKSGSVGKSTGQDIAIVDDALPTLKFLLPDTTGEIVVRGPSVINGYEDNPDANAKAFVDGWFRTGDQGYLDRDGYLFITGRIKEIISRAGEKISPYEIEDVLLRHPAVVQAAVFAVPHVRLGEDVVAAVVLRPKDDRRSQAPVTERILLEYAAEHLAAYKAPSRIILVDDIPKGPTGKIQRTKLVARLGLIANETAPAMTEQERHKLLVEWNATAADYRQSNATLSELFEAQVVRSPGALALRGGEEQFSYSEVNAQANQLARCLSQRISVQDRQAVPIIALCMERSSQAIIVMLAILKLGAAYLPLDLDTPAARLAMMLSDSGARTLITDQHGLAALLSQGFPADLTVISLDDPGVAEQIAQQSADNLPDQSYQNGADDPAAYVLYTSGSTGQPKGVVGTHRGMVNRITWMARTFPFTPDEMCCQKTSLAFVDSIAEIFAPLLHGVPLFVIPPPQATDPQALIDALASQHVTRIGLVPSLLNAILECCPNWRGKLPDLRLVISSGEALPRSLAARFAKATPHARLLNLYGSTEVAADVTYYEVTATHDGNGRDAGPFVPIGRPIANTQVYILDEQLAPVPLSATGELYIGGAGLASGYLNRPDLTSEQFIANPFISGARLYRTGDLARYVPDDAPHPPLSVPYVIQYVGRQDRQVKIRGVRVDPGEIEAALLTYPGVRQAAVIAEPDPADPIKGQRLVAFLVQDQGQQASPHGESALRAYLRDRLIAQMIPASYLWRDALPMTPGGKIDRQALIADRLASGGDNSRGAVSVDPPVDALQAKLVSLWQQALNRPSVGIHDDFFDLGGHSLLAARLFVQMRERLGVKLPLATLFRASTIAQLADIIRQGDTSSDAILIPLRSLDQTDGSRPPLFCFHALYGHVLIYDRLAQHLDQNQPVYAIQALGVDGEQQPLRRVEDMVLRYLPEIRAIQPHGPYYLCGYSFGGRIALEIARLLRAEGEVDVRLLLIDERFANSKLKIRWHGKPRSVFHHIGRRLQTAGYALTFLPVRYRGMYLRERGEALAGWVKGKIQPGKANGRAFKPDYMAGDMTEAVQNVAKANMEAAYDYEPLPYDGPITFLRAANDIVIIPQLRALRYVAKGSLEIEDVPGTHYTLLDETNIGVVASRAQRWLNEANGR